MHIANRHRATGCIILLVEMEEESPALRARSDYDRRGIGRLVFGDAIQIRVKGRVITYSI